MLNVKNISKKELGEIANIRHIRNLLRTSLSVSETLSVFNKESLQELRQNIKKSITVCNNELAGYEKQYTIEGDNDVEPNRP